MGESIFPAAVEGNHKHTTALLPLPQEGRIVVFMVKDEATFHLRKSGRNAIKQFGSLLINNVGWRDMWVLVAKKRNKWYVSYHQ